MCCSTSVHPVVKETAEAILALGMFTTEPKPDGYGPAFWEREVVDDDGQHVIVRAQIVGDRLNLSLDPRITEADPRHGRVSGGVYMEIACKVAEKCNASIVQHSNIGACIENSDRVKTLAVYPDQPLDWAAVCSGFQRSILGEALT